MTGTTYVDLLGQLSVRHDDRPVSIRSLKQRHLLATLALHAGQVVSHEKIIDALWGENPPATSLALVHTYVARLRKALQSGCDGFGADSASPSLIRHTGTGYRLDLGTHQVDLLRFLDVAAKAHEEHATRNAERAEELFHEALRMWRGSVLADLDHRLGQDPVILNAVHLRLTSTLAYADLALERGHFHEAVRQLRSVTPEEPVHEGLHARLMLALAGAGQQAAALELFTHVRERLSETLGIDPGPEIEAAQLRVLRQDLPFSGAGGPRTAPWKPPVPAQLPLDIAGFTGRAEPLRQLSRLRVASGDPASGPAIAAITGPPGAGKTALAVSWGHQAQIHFPDGQLYAELRGVPPFAPRTTTETLSMFLRALGVPPEAVPDDEDEQAALYRSLLAHRRILVVLDNVASSHQVRPLLPAGRRCMVVVTSRTEPTGLIALEGAQPIRLGAFTPQESSVLIRRLTYGDPAGAETGPGAELGQLSGHLPLALRLAATDIGRRCLVSCSAAAAAPRTRYPALASRPRTTPA
ncbi:BTAD domain-containing putative transcriptional regulator [Streptomyces sp. NPDC094034]|uniref:AfsR/SARP family transcriptional regulator n=1 Tax=Streptomyces sp. NPDC094034 TaxID=3155309 RepID=UPI003320C962